MLGVEVYRTMAPEAAIPALTGHRAPPHRAVRAGARRSGLQPALKRGMDILGAALLLLLCAPLFAVLALLIRADGGPALFAHERVGLGGRRFGCLKFRSMVTDSQARLAA